MKRLALLAGAETLIGLHGAEYSDPQREATGGLAVWGGENGQRGDHPGAQGGGQAALLTQIEAALSQAQSGGVPLSLYLERDDQSAALSSPFWRAAGTGGGSGRTRARLSGRAPAPEAPQRLGRAADRPAAQQCQWYPPAQRPAPVQHCDQDGGHVNYADLAAADLPGCQPAPLLVRLLPGGSSPERLGRVLLACGMAPPALEGELAAPAAGLSTSLLADAGASNQAARRLSWSGRRPACC
jgi:hypothetical protein